MSSCRQTTLSRGNQRKHRVGRRRAEELHATGVLGLGERRDDIAAEPLELGQRGAVAGRLGLAGGRELGLDVGDVQLGGADAELPRELDQALGYRGILELVGEHRRDAHRHVLRHGENGQVGANDRVEQPLLPERVGPEPLDVRHVRVQDERDVADALAQRRQTATKSSARSRFASDASRSAKSAVLIAGVKRS